MERWLAAIARRNVAWARWRDALELLAIHRDELGFTDVRDEIGQVNDTQYEYEHACRDLVRARVWLRIEQAA